MGVFEAQSAKRKTWRAVASNVSPGNPLSLSPCGCMRVLGRTAVRPMFGSPSLFQGKGAGDGGLDAAG
jgi:hypothetical protein